MSDTSKQVCCPRHGDSHATYVCRHLANGRGRGFFCADDEDDPRPDAWRAACDEVLRQEGEWNDRSEAFAAVTLLCAGCYDEARWQNGSEGRKTN
jgi:hypothetical protein